MTGLDALIQAFGVLRPHDDETGEAIAELLGVPWIPVPDADLAARRAGGDAHRDVEPALDAPRDDALEQPEYLPMRAEVLTIDEPERSVSANFLTDGPTLDAKAGPSTLPPVTPLIEPRGARWLLSRIAATLEEGGPIDLEAVIASRVRVRPLRRLPRVQVRSLRRGLQLLIDGSAAMAPYRADQEAVRHELARLYSKDRLDVVRFKGFPDLDHPQPGRRWSPPAPGVPILVLSDLGLGPGPDRPDPADWKHLADHISSPVVALVPQPPSCWPSWLRRSVSMVYWGRTSSVQPTRGER